MGFSVDIKGAEAVREMLSGLKKRAENIDAATKPAAQELDRLIKKGFSMEASPYGEPWAPLSDKTIELRKHGGSKPLQDTGLLKLQSTAKADGRDVVFGVTGSSSLYAPKHLWGDAGPPRIPQRKFLPVDDGSPAAPDFSSGPAKDWFDRLRARVSNWILHGKRSAKE